MGKIWEDEQIKNLLSDPFYGGTGSELSDQEKFLPLDNEFPVMVTEEGHIVCIPTTTKDQPRIGCFGKIRSGKTLMLNRLFNRFYWIGKKRSLWLNDRTDETFFHGNKMRTSQMVKVLSEFGEKTCDTPFIHLFPHVPNSDLLKYRSGISAEFCFPFIKMLEKPDLFLDLGGSDRYFKAIVPQLKEAKCPEDVYDIVSSIPNKSVVRKINDTLKFYFDEEIFDITARGKVYCKGIIFDKESGKTKKYPVIPSLLLMDACVSIHSKDLITKNYMRPYEEMIIRDLLDLYQNDPLFFKTPLHLAIDEISFISSSTIENNAIREIARLGTLPIALSYANQSYLKTDNHLIKNTRMAFCFGFQDRAEAKAVVQNFGQDSVLADSIMRLKSKDRECILFTDMDVNVYDLENNDKYVVSGEAIKGIALPPPSNNKTPNQSLKLRRIYSSVSSANG